MTTEQRSELDKAIERAARKGIRIVGRGVLKGSGVRYFITNGRTAQRNHDHVLHYVRIEGVRLVCDCLTRAPHICKHRGRVYLELAAEHAAIKAAQVLEARMLAAQETHAEPSCPLCDEPEHVSAESLRRDVSGDRWSLVTQTAARRVAQDAREQALDEWAEQSRWCA